MDENNIKKQEEFRGKFLHSKFSKPSFPQTPGVYKETFRDHVLMSGLENSKPSQLNHRLHRIDNNVPIVPGVSRRNPPSEDIKQIGRRIVSSYEELYGDVDLQKGRGNR